MSFPTLRQKEINFLSETRWIWPICLTGLWHTLNIFLLKMFSEKLWNWGEVAKQGDQQQSLTQRVLKSTESQKRKTIPQHTICFAWLDKAKCVNSSLTITCEVYQVWPCLPKKELWEYSRDTLNLTQITNHIFQVLSCNFIAPDNQNLTKYGFQWEKNYVRK